MSDVPLGMFLSGGLDSSAIAALMARMIDRPLQTFSVAFKERAFSELTWSREVAQAVGADTHEIVIGADQFFDALPRLVWHEDEPIAHPSSVPLYFVSALAREHVTVVLTGEGSDELLAGYGKYPRALLNWRAGGLYARVMPDTARRWFAERVIPALPGRAARYARRSFLGVEHTPEAAFFDNFAAVPLARQRELFDARLRASATREGAYSSSRVWLDRPRHAPLLDRMLYADMKTYLVELLMKQDQMSMAASIESRVPFLDHKLVEFVATMPDGVEALRLHHEASLARGGERPAPRSRSSAARRWGFPCRSGSGRADPGEESSAMCCSIAGRASGGCSTPCRSPGSWTITRRAAPKAATSCGASSISNSGIARGLTATVCSTSASSSAAATPAAHEPQPVGSLAGTL